MRRRIPEPCTLTTRSLCTSDTLRPDSVLQTSNMMQMLGVLDQLGLCATYSHELFEDIAAELDKSFDRINKLKTRLGNALGASSKAKGHGP